MNTEERLLNLMEKLEAKEKALKQLIEKKENIAQLSKRLKNEIAVLKDEIKTASRDDLGEFLEQNGIAFDDVRAAVKNGVLRKAEYKTNFEESISEKTTEVVNSEKVNEQEEK